jgi:hypothetical protein
MPNGVPQWPRTVGVGRELVKGVDALTTSTRDDLSGVGKLFHYDRRSYPITMATGIQRRSDSRRITYPHEVIREDRPLVRPTGRLEHRAGVVAFVLVALVIVVTFLHLDAGNPPGSYRDESNISTNAATIADSARDEHGRLLPLYFESHSDWKSAPYIYLLAAVFTLTGPDEGAARALSAVLGLTAVVLLGILGHRLSGDPIVGLATATLAAATP